MKKIILTPKAPSPIGPYSQAVQFGNQLFLSGQIAIVPETGELLKGSLEEETHLVMKNMGAVLAEAGIDYKDLVKCGIFLADMADFQTVNSVYAQYFDEAQAPARETVAVKGLPKGVRVEISGVAFKD